MKKVLMMALMLATVVSMDVMAEKGKMADKFDDSGCFIMKEDMKDKMAEKLATADANNDGCITRVEMKAAMPEGGRKGKKAE